MISDGGLEVISDGGLEVISDGGLEVISDGALENSCFCGILSTCTVKKTVEISQ